ncbi:MAG TPA: L,D-transpeptidase, partial [Syntrophorhabdales bacterium]|nr:L,D-transpeptidase [Syntrophorhabdales bacterium]
MESDRARRAYEKLRGFLDGPNEIFLVQSIEAQRLLVCEGQTIVERYDASTSRFGYGIRENSFKTPIGLHRIKEKIGAGAPPGRIFRGRMDTGVDWNGASIEDNLILTRILRLEGLEEGINKGPGVDSFERFIYIHGTNREDLIGTPLSAGCLALRNRDIVRLFEIVREGTLVYIEPPPMDIAARQCRSVHFTGIFGSGMSALAQF